jgi:hypothetical protein
LASNGSAKLPIGSATEECNRCPLAVQRAGNLCEALRQPAFCSPYSTRSDCDAWLLASALDREVHPFLLIIAQAEFERQLWRWRLDAERSKECSITLDLVQLGCIGNAMGEKASACCSGKAYSVCSAAGNGEQCGPNAPLEAKHSLYTRCAKFGCKTHHPAKPAIPAALVEDNGARDGWIRLCERSGVRAADNEHRSIRKRVTNLLCKQHRKCGIAQKGSLDDCDCSIHCAASYGAAVVFCTCT